MIHYALRCAAGHGFEGWFRSSADFDVQARRGLLTCPDCGTGDVSRALMAPAVVSGAAPREATVADAASPGPASQAPSEGDILPPQRSLGSGPLPDAVRALLGRLRSEIERNCEDVGRDFAAQALSMHRGEIARRGIYGETTEGEREALADEGVEVTRIPWLPRSES